jgi:hypothetical protein
MFLNHISVHEQNDHGIWEMIIRPAHLHGDGRTELVSGQFVCARELASPALLPYACTPSMDPIAF